MVVLIGLSNMQACSSADAIMFKGVVADPLVRGLGGLFDPQPVGWVGRMAEMLVMSCFL